MKAPAVVWNKLDMYDESTLPPADMHSSVLVVKITGGLRWVDTESALCVRRDVLDTKALGGTMLFTHWAHLPTLPSALD